MLQRIAFPGEEAAQLLGLSDVQPDLEKQDAFLCQHAFEVGHLRKERVLFRFAAKPEHRFHNRAVIPGAVEENDFTLGRQVPDITLKIPFSSLAVRWFGQRDGPRDAGVQIFVEAFDRTAFSRGVAAFKDYDDAFAGFLDVGLKSHKFKLKLFDFCFVLGLLLAFLVRIIVTENVFLFAILNGLPDRAGGFVFEEMRDCAAVGKAHVMHLYFFVTLGGGWH